MVKSFSKMHILSFFEQFFANILLILKVEQKSFPMMYHLSYLDIKHGIKGVGQIDRILVFKYPSRDRVKLSKPMTNLKLFILFNLDNIQLSISFAIFIFIHAYLNFFLNLKTNQLCIELQKTLNEVFFALINKIICSLILTEEG